MCSSVFSAFFSLPSHQQKCAHRIRALNTSFRCTDRVIACFQITLVHIHTYTQSHCDRLSRALWFNRILSRRQKKSIVLYSYQNTWLQFSRISIAFNHFICFVWFFSLDIIGNNQFFFSFLFLVGIFCEYKKYIFNKEKNHWVDCILINGLNNIAVYVKKHRNGRKNDTERNQRQIVKYCIIQFIIVLISSLKWNYLFLLFFEFEFRNPNRMHPLICSM